MWSIRGKFLAASAAALVILVVIGVASFQTIRNLVNTGEYVSQTHQVLEALQALDSTTKDFLRGARGFALSGQEDQLEPYVDASSAYPVLIARLRKLLSENPNQTERLKKAEDLISQVIHESTTIVKLRRVDADSALQRVKLGVANQLMDRVVQAIGTMQEFERTRLQDREQSARQAARQAQNIILIGSALALLIAGLAGWVIQRDLTRREQTERALRENEEKFRAFVETTGEWIWSADREGRRTYSNPAVTSILGYTPQELLGHHVLELVHPEDKTDAGERFSTFATGKKGWTGMTLKFRHLNGSYRWLESNAVPIVSEEGDFQGFRGADRDVSERRKAEETAELRARDLARSNAELEQFAYVASHDLQEPLRMVVNYCKLLERRYSGKLDKDADDFIHFAVDGAVRMQRLIEDLLAYSRVGTKGAKFVPTDCNKVVEQAMANLKMAIMEKSAEVTYEKLPTVMGDFQQLTQLFQNLIGNSLKFQTPGQVPRVQISAEGKDGEWLFTVKDNGIGMDPEFFEKIFVIFQRLHTKAEYSGTGIGLAICRKIVERHGGRIWVDSQEGQGTTFQFTLISKKERRHE